MEMDSIYTGLQNPSEDVYSTVNTPQGKRAGAEQDYPTPPVSAAGKASSYRRPVLVLLILCCLLLAAIISLAVYHFKTKEDPEKYTTLLNQLQDLSSDYSNLNKNHSELKKSNTELSVKSSILDKYCPLKEGSSKERGCCPEKWVPFNGKCYNFSPDTMDWHSSRASCVSMGADLVIIEGEAEQRFLLNEAKAHPGNRYWIGLTDAVTEGVWLWVDDTPLNDKAKYWYGKEPSDDKEGWDSSGQDCADLMYMSDTLKVWFDQSCTQQPNRRICETMAVIINI
ncbi:C-type lectin domain family 4 member E-like isoform X1 [Acipenser ruthenus]|uniref:C-type lectin domain family 4 member E-like isoform X1 n=1 Tax=Acipenser ruthenus TaxID=7906 RepID=UPI002741422A|nr:C-type lectin domain family 4 member E-like isoform X1 [Acipenser ruthenus]XP_058849513.1 C-type lectin domain family 4 member E-like isoform X1 [Acipenser ruthenus]